MKHYGFDNPEGSSLKNLTAPSGTAFPDGTSGDPPNVGELFFRTDQNKMYYYSGSEWIDISTAVEAFTSRLAGYQDTGLLEELDNSFDIDSIDYNSTYGFDTTNVTGTLGGLSGWYILHTYRHPRAAEYSVQMAYGYAGTPTGEIWGRVNNNGTWSTWVLQADVNGKSVLADSPPLATNNTSIPTTEWVRDLIEAKFGTGFGDDGLLELFVGDINTIDYNSVYDISTSSTTNFPSDVPAGSACTLETFGHNATSDWAVQRLMVYSAGLNGNVYWRRKVSGTWEAWRLSSEGGYSFNQHFDGFNPASRRHDEFTGDLNDIDYNSRFSIQNDGGVLNMPSDSGSLHWGWVETIMWSGDVNWGIQRLYGMNGDNIGKVWQRLKNAGTWQSWILVQEGDISIGTYLMTYNRAGGEDFIRMAETASGNTNGLGFRASAAGDVISLLGYPSGAANWNHRLYYDFSVNQFRYSTTATAAGADDLQLPNMGMVRDAISALGGGKIRQIQFAHVTTDYTVGGAWGNTNHSVAITTTSGSNVLVFAWFDYSVNLSRSIAFTLADDTTAIGTTSTYMDEVGVKNMGSLIAVDETASVGSHTYRLRADGSGTNSGTIYGGAIVAVEYEA